jgi:predicted nucleotidyltransferase
VAEKLHYNAQKLENLCTIIFGRDVKTKNLLIVKATFIMVKVKNVIDRFKKEVKKLYGKKLKGIILYGSWARGEATEESDIDLAVVLSDNVKPGKEIERMADLITDINLEYNVLISVYPVSAKDYAKTKSPLLMNIRKEGKKI